MRTEEISAACDAPLILDDQDLDYWAHVYARLDLLSRGYTFEDFLRATPQVRENAARLAELALRPRTRLGALVSVRLTARHIDALALSSKELQALRSAMRTSVVLGNGRRVEKLRHHRFPKSRNAFFSKA